MKTPTADDRTAWLGRVAEPGAHAEIVASLDCLTDIESKPAPARPPHAGWLRVAAWNIEQGRRSADLADVIRTTGADVALLTEVDWGMVRTSNVHVIDDLATRLDAGYAWGIEFIELAPGNHQRGLHGNAILSRLPLRDPRVVRLDDGGEWFNATTDQPRVGGRMAVVATIELDGNSVTLASVHLESRSDADQRAAQMKIVLDQLGDGPAIVGGDLNTFGTSIPRLADRGAVSRMRADEPTRFSWPVAHEPLFALAGTYGFEWVDANLAAPTTNHDGAGLPDHHPLKLDWLLVRGLEARRPTVVPSTAPDGARLSDHEMVAISVRFELGQGSRPS
jgi:endonuclease/exonuclease/phosphatase family metal-dependent hydrolase